MAKAGDKKRLEQNADHIRKLKIIVIVANVRRCHHAILKEV